jgi:hypothetical protein
MDILTWVEALLKLGLPMAAASWVAFGWLYGSGEFENNSSQKEMESRAKKVKKNSLGSSNKKARFLLEKWSRFGGGFYGLAGLWTFIVIEGGQLIDFFVRGGFSTLGEFSLITLIINIIVGQISSFITAVIWFTYWPEPGDSMLAWVLIAFIGYRLGIELAKGRFKLTTQPEQ